MILQILQIVQLIVQLIILISIIIMFVYKEPRYKWAHKNDALKDAAMRGQLDYIKYLVKQGADIHYDNDAAFQLAALNGHSEVLKYLQELNEDK